MAKKKGAAREYVTMECAECNSRNYRTSRRVKGGAPRLELRKFCQVCRAHKKHVERRK
ncbi:MAG TPA: 50S ribosomal protein L33 [Planctomycetota bacterium]|jgi:large subunit ribosomal protein L33|nr:50S ribosomal protein L33 [Planctomycetota bacterium]OQC19604.1 MAG: 50S ribosomal protein L33 [Planctomycetes bacterium ADurb.Bin069]NMD36936.1 50S ribosomal protein L33 [Planctomycetota bacterium]HNR99016.1 50S ribosomal protein L33 [Planctomycetota bacterium]HOE30231.1 50S ribosomal protein L33 [Planctomycetota bacterium]